jgi:hypothetical protein
LIDAGLNSDCIIQPITVRSYPQLLPGVEYTVVLKDSIVDFAAGRLPIDVDSQAALSLPLP